MTQTQLDNLVTELKCCSGKLANEIANSLYIGGCDRSKELILLIGYIGAIEDYRLDEDDNCLEDDDFNKIIVLAKNICNTCGCNN